MNLTPCPFCGGLFPDISGPTHRYMASSPGCWALFGEVLAREYSDPTYFEIHRLTVDTYAVQHPGEPSPQSIKSVGLHLVRLCLILERGLAMEDANDAVLEINKAKDNFVWLAPPTSLGAVNVNDVFKAEDDVSHKAAVRVWAASVWEAWYPHHAAINEWISVHLSRSLSVR